MKKQFYLFIALIAFSSTAVMAQLTENIVFPSGGIGPINAYSVLDGQYGDANTDAEGLVQAVFCYDSTIDLDAVELGTNEAFASYEWFKVDEEGNELESISSSQTIEYTHTQPGYHRFRVYGYNQAGQEGCFEISDIAVYVFPRIEVEEYTPVPVDFCENEVESLAEYAEGDGVVLNISSLSISTVNPNNDTYELNYEWYITKDGVREVLQGGDYSEYKIGEADNDLTFELGEIQPGTYTYGVKAYYVFEGEAICEIEDKVLYDLTITEAPDKPVIRVGGTPANSRQQLN